MLPGPGAYNPSDIDSASGSYVTSNFRNTGNVKFIKPKLGDPSFRSKTPMNARIGKSHSIWNELWKSLCYYLLRSMKDGLTQLNKI